MMSFMVQRSLSTYVVLLSYRESSGAMPELTEFQRQLANGLRIAAERQIVALVANEKSAGATHDGNMVVNDQSLAQIADFLKLLEKNLAEHSEV